MLPNAYFLAKFRFDTAENEPAKNLQNFRKMHFSKMQWPRILWREVVPVHGYLDHRPAPTRALPLSRSKYAVTQGVSTAEAPAKQIISPERRPCVDLHIQEYFGRMGVKSVKLCLFF